MTTPGLEAVTADEQAVRFDKFDYDDAWRLGCQMRDIAASRNLPLVIGVTHGQQRAFHAALPGAYPENDQWLSRKLGAARRYGRSSMGVLEFFLATGRDFDTQSRLPAERFAAAGGVVPVQVTGVGIVGYVGVSGLPHREDHAFVMEQLKSFSVST
ncbi:heme-degrading domain-containing protein [Rhodococcus sp. BP-252]|uniref:heme-degrading domain-containing protein n=1 Tax=unclassified Rhodococcus (in: high G+C Gram-positive bacteria) TaxID=192944 RepID=UPI001C9BA3A7|nr:MULTISPECIES: heme-degrading domain-containing protein [unclassified Rhodococcus (in: high G+C Gram-positive bacteria)]MBY6414322.1 heme-degrading domain-containing protein [Rhodococcus sp. BP-320]MBY6419092.1 heme-degrading domain-containing protein [Rhodococcus sp. BP-321]MBY6423817.1 heme-degrading domain-containing protein [Rhodococcus sp. BP-324]MBY6429201.1 heme-degrading domain-containing protein [Rhodococcus sp. BP-323]MBY6434132.1 heme-degrading domain-containing protein [Rhodococc